MAILLIAPPSVSVPVLFVVSEFVPPSIVEAKLMLPAAPAVSVGFADVIVVGLKNAMVPPAVVKSAPRLIPLPAVKL